MAQSVNIQDQYLNQLRKNHIFVTVFFNKRFSIKRNGKSI